MSQFNRSVLGKNSIPESDKGVSFTELISILGESAIATQLLNLLDKDQYLDDFIAIPGASTLVQIQKKINKRFFKEDLESLLDDIDLYNDKTFSINFNNLKTSKYLQDLKLTEIKTEPIYSATRDFFSSLFQMDKYASTLIEKGHKDIVKANLSLLKSIQQLKRRYRILHDRDEKAFYLRAIISMNNYYDYNNNIAVVIGLLMLHDEMKKGKAEYSLYRCEYNESFVRMFFESSQIKQLEKIGHVKNIIEISNDEIKRESLRFSGVCMITFKDAEGNSGDLFIQPHDIKSKILSIRHNQLPTTAMEELSNMSHASKIHDTLYDDIAKITQIKDPEQIKHLVRKKVENAKSEEVKRFKQEYLNELKKGANNIIQLLTIFKKMEMLSNEDIDAAEYIRYVIYMALVEKK